jgi:deoxyribodipyrimidine photo-lyase
MPSRLSATHAAALAALDVFLPRVPQYSSRRGFATADNQGVSRLSPFLRRRVITEQEVVLRVLEAYPFQVAEKFVQEVVWRTYWKGWLERNPKVWSACVESEANYLREANVAAWGAEYERACRAETRFPFFNDWMRELIESGYLHNHIRMWFASVWIFTLKLPWQLGAMLMYRHLLDGDPASNTLSWRWVAGLQTKGKWYLARADNIDMYSEGRWKPKPGELAESAFSIGDDCEPVKSHGVSRVYGSVPAGAYGVITTSEDLAVERDRELMKEASAVGLLRADFLHQESELVSGFVRGVEEDFLGRLGARGVGISTPGEVAAWAKAQQCEKVVIVAPAVGPESKRIEQVAEQLVEHGVQCVWYQSEWDAQLHRLADKGFFPFWERVKKRIGRGEALFAGRGV